LLPALGSGFGGVDVENEIGQEKLNRSEDQ
jgi:hypothetical protein